MIYEFRDYELDLARRELRRRGEVIDVQSLVFDLLVYLVEHRSRLVTKQELLEGLWQDVVVTEGSLQRAISLARKALGGDRDLIRTYSRHGYRFMGEVAHGGKGRRTEATERFRPRYVRAADGTHIAYHTLGEGDVDIVLIFGWILPMSAIWELDESRIWCQDLAKLGRVVLFDKRGSGLSDHVNDLPGLDLRMDDLRAVLDEIGSRSAVIVGISEGGPMSLLYAATFPDRTQGLALVGSFARLGASADYPCGMSADAIERARVYIKQHWGDGRTILATVASRARDKRVLEWARATERNGASPGSALDFLEMNLKVDARGILAAIAVPTVIIHRLRDKMISAENGRYLASRIPGAKYVEVAGEDHMFIFDGGHRIIDEVRWLLAQQRLPQEERVLATVVRLRSRTGEAEETPEVRARLERYRGRAVESDGPAFLFDSPARAVGFARESVSGRGLAAGIHTSEIRVSGDVVDGAAITLSDEMAAQSTAGEVRISETTVDLTPGAGFEFETAGEVESPHTGRKIVVYRLADDAPGQE